jgi:hypothetical protein
MSSTGAPDGGSAAKSLFSSVATSDDGDNAANTAEDSSRSPKMLVDTKNYASQPSDDDEDSDGGSDVSMGSDSDGSGNSDDDKMENVLGLSRLSAVASDMKRGDIWKACYDITVWPFFWIFLTVLLMAEPCICSYSPYEYRNVIRASWIIIALSSFCLLIQIGGKTYVIDEKSIMDKARELHMRQKGTTAGEEEITTSKKWVTMARIMFSGSFVLELFCITIGWVFIFYRPGIAALRCFRAFRVLWFHELPPQILEPLKRMLSAVLGRTLVDLIFKVMKFATVTLSHLGQEMLFLTKKSRGGFILMGILFYIAYVLGATLWVETQDSDLDNEFCATIGSCTYTMIRLTFFDGNGFDFAYSLTENHKILFTVTVMYLCVTSFGIVNGLIGVFGDIFKDDSDRIFETNKAAETKAQMLENEHFQRYNNTSESLVLITLKVAQLEEQNDMLREHLNNIGKALKVDPMPIASSTFKMKNNKSSRTKKHSDVLRSIKGGDKGDATAGGGGTGSHFFY